MTFLAYPYLSRACKHVSVFIARLHNMQMCLFNTAMNKPILHRDRRGVAVILHRRR